MNNYLKILCLSLSTILMVNSSFAAMNFPDDLEPLIKPKKIKLIRALNLIDDAEKQGLINRLGENWQHAISMILEKVSPSNNNDDGESLQGMIEVIMDLPSFDPNMSCGPNSTLLIQAIRSKDDGYKYHRIEKLLKLKADPNKASNIGTPLYEAVALNDLKAVKLLLNYGANDNKGGSKKGSTPIKLAAQKRYDDIIEVLQEHGAISETNSKPYEEKIIRANLSAHLATELVNITMSYLYEPRQLSLGNFHSCAINRDSKLLCWANNGVDSIIVPDELKNDQVRKVGVGSDYTCAINSVGKLFCWRPVIGGKNDASALNPRVPDELKNDRVEHISVDGDTACAINIVGKLFCWKMNEVSEEISVPVELKNERIRNVSVGDFHVCAINRADKLFCFRTNSVFRQPYVPDNLNNDRMEQISVGIWHTCAINKARKLFCWGDNTYGQTNIPDELKNDQVEQVSVGTTFTCATNKDGKLFCWGGLDCGQEFIPDELRNDRVEQISAALDFVCATNTEGQLFCWGHKAARTPWGPLDEKSGRMMSPVKL